jgi:hypothetical protein
LFITWVVICWRVESLLMFNGFFFKSHLLERLRFRNPLVANSCSISLLPTK